ncbi:MAG TPA: DNA topoisomerase IB [Candidatus Acidoferrales bacterium]|nr:DNA topoisomerase IB [Candidatus Acidoferrales bacterium]
MNETPAEAARHAGLRYVSDAMPGLRRKRSGKRFAYVDPAGKAIRDEDVLSRIRALAIPPAYEDVWICPAPNGHIQATARDARGRKQYRYHARWREVRDGTKYERMVDFAKALPAIRKRVDADLRLAGMPREKLLAAVVRLLETTTIRIGNDEYARENQSFGLTTLQNKHASVRGGTVTFSFRGKSGIKHAIGLQDKRLAKIVRACQDIPGQQLFEYVDEDGVPHNIDSSDVNSYIREIGGDDFTAKDFRTWVGTVHCAVVLAGRDAGETAAERKSILVEAVKEVAVRLGNTAAVCRKSYIHPQVFAAYEERGSLAPIPSGGAARGLLPQERYVVKLLAPTRRSRRRRDRSES